ncbi:MAG: penicillin-binding protein activator [Alphaproteobacteria bacterium]|nr:penicillin-binding protein activator [Alphaproteobacteria bacterium]
MRFFLSIFLIFNLISCSSQRNITIPQKHENIDLLKDDNLKKIASENAYNKVLVLLPLSGKNSELGKGILNACILAIGESENVNIDFIVIDTADRSLDKNQLVRKYENNHVKAIVGPVFFTEAKRYGALFPKIPMFTFSNNIKANSKHIFTCGLSPQDEINEILAYARRKEMNGLLIMLPKGSYGDEIEQYLKNSMKNFDFDEDSNVEIMRYNKMNKENTMKYVEDSDKDAVFLLDPLLDIPNLTRHVTVFTLSSNALQNREDWLGSVFAFSSIQELFNFSEKYKMVFNHTPSVLDMVGYDIVRAIIESSNDKHEPFVLENRVMQGCIGEFTITKDKGLKRNLRLYESE